MHDALRTIEAAAKSDGQTVPKWIRSTINAALEVKEGN
jgi:hypothetical protein